MPSLPLFVSLFLGLGRRDDHLQAEDLQPRPEKRFDRYDTQATQATLTSELPAASWISTIKSRIPQSEVTPEIAPHYRRLPIISGLLIPFAILMEIPGLTEHWYVKIDPVTRVVAEYRENSKLLKAGLAISTASAVIANGCLLSRFLEKRILVATLLAMIFLTIHDMISIVTLAIFGYNGRHKDGFTFAQAYWTTVASTAISSIVNVTLLVDFVQTKNFASVGSGLTRKQRSLVIIVIILFCWVTVGAGCFAAIMKISFEDALYFTVVSMETIGFGDISPGKNTSARIFTIFFILTAIFNLALAVSTIRGVVAEAFQHAARRRRILANRARLRRQRELDTLPPSEFIYHGGGKRVNEHKPSNTLHGPTAVISTNGIVHVLRKVASILLWWRDADNEDDDYIDYLERAQEQQQDLSVLATGRHLFAPRIITPESDDEFCREVAKNETRERNGLAGISLAAFVMFWLIGGAIFSGTEGWSFGSALYFCFIAWTTVGYGDLYPKSQAGKAIFIVWALLGVGGLTILISVISEAYATNFSIAVDHGAYDTHVFNRLQVRTIQARSEELEVQRQQEEQFNIGHGLTATKARLNQLAADLLVHAQTYHPHMKDVFGADRGKGYNLNRALKRLLLKELEEEDGMTRAVVLKNHEMRKAIFTVGYDRSFDRLYEAILALNQAIDEDSGSIIEGDGDLFDQTTPGSPGSPGPGTSIPIRPTWQRNRRTVFDSYQPEVDFDTSVVDNHVIS